MMASEWIWAAKYEVGVLKMTKEIVMVVAVVASSCHTPWPWPPRQEGALGSAFLLALGTIVTALHK